ncbi:MAG: MFS transporter [Parvularcula sp.]|nr:MFS transporter [Parvularcula sp.]
MSDTTSGTPQHQGWFRSLTAPYRRPEMAAMLLLGFASGLPLYLVYQKTSFWLRLEGIDRSTIGFFYWVGLAYSFKFIWAPIIDKVQVPFLGAKLGHRRSWMIASISGTVLGLLIISTADPSSNLMPVTLGALLLAFSGATLDVSIDAWRIESAPTERQANMAAAYSLGYRGALIFSGLGFVVADFSNWNISFVVMALAMALTGALVLLVREPERQRGSVIASTDPLPARLWKLFGEPFVQVWRRFGVVLIPILVLVLIYRLSDFTMGVMASPLYADLGYAPAVVGSMQSGPGVVAIIVGLFLGGLAAQRFGLMPSLIIGAALTFVTNGAYAWFASVASGDDVAYLALAICADNLAGGFVTTVFIAYLSSLVDPANAATQYALFSSLYAFLNKFVAGFSGVMADALGYVTFFLVTASYAIPAALLVGLVWHLQRRYPPAPVRQPSAVGEPA